jgi:hypothetical protein
MSSQVKAALGTYGRALLACVATAIVTVGGTTPLYAFTKAEWLQVANAVWVALFPVLIRALNPNDTTYGVGA